MARTPSYPEDAPVAQPKGGASGAPAVKAPAEDSPDPAGPAEGEAAKAPESKRTRHLVTGAAIGIGSAAIVAALLYANRSKRT